ncbi:phospholipase D-like domain-containing protein [Rhodanobacter umsongensis]
MKDRCGLSVAVKAALFSAVFCAGCVGVSRQTPADEGSRASTTATRTLVIEPDQGLTPIYNLIQSARSSIDMTMYELVDTQASGLLCSAAENGIAVRVILDQNLEKSSNQAAYTQLQGCGVSVVWAWTTYAATHQKTITIDDTTSVVMTLNLTSRYYSTTRDFAVIENDPGDVAAIESTFNADFKAQTITPPVGDDLVWSPTVSQTDLVNLINGAKDSLLIENEEMSYSAIVTALENAAKRGVKVTVCMTNDNNTYESEFEALTKAGVKISTYPDTTTGLYIHAKAIVADYGTSTAQAFVGSENFSSASLTENRELGLITTTAAILTQLDNTLSSDYAGGTPWTKS